jgi:hypothetical protein
MTNRVDLDQEGELLQRGHGMRGARAVDAGVEFDPDEGGGDRLGQACEVGDLGEG